MDPNFWGTNLVAESKGLCGLREHANRGRGRSLDVSRRRYSQTFNGYRARASGSSPAQNGYVGRTSNGGSLQNPQEDLSSRLAAAARDETIIKADAS